MSRKEPRDTELLPNTAADLPHSQSTEAVPLHVPNNKNNIDNNNNNDNSSNNSNNHNDPFYFNIVIIVYTRTQTVY